MTLLFSLQEGGWMGKRPLSLGAVKLQSVCAPFIAEQCLPGGTRPGQDARLRIRVAQNSPCPQGAALTVWAVGTRRQGGKCPEEAGGSQTRTAECSASGTELGQLLGPRDRAEEPERRLLRDCSPFGVEPCRRAQWLVASI